MMSADSSWIKFIREQKALLWRRLPFLALSILMYFLYDVFGTVLVIQKVRLDSLIPDETAPISFSLKAAEAMSAYMGIRSVGWFIGFTGAVILGIQGFAFLYNSRTVDFYESRPEKRSKRFTDIAVNSFLIYALPSLAGALLSIVISAVNGVFYPALSGEILLSWVLQSIMFLAAYGMSTLVSLLAGTLITSILLNLFTFSLEGMIRLTILGYRSAYYATFDGEGGFDTLLSIKTFPPFNLFYGLVESSVLGNEIFDPAGSLVSSAFPFLVPGLLINAALAVVTIALAFFAYKKRRSEDAGKAVVSGLIGIIIKYTTAIIFGLDAGLFSYWIFNRDRGGSLPAVILTIIIAAVITCLVIEAILALNVRSAFHRVYDIPVILILSFVILFVYRTDTFGFDRWLPDPSSVESAWLNNYSYNQDYYDEYGKYISARDYCKKNMFITDIDDMLKIAEKGQETQVLLANRPESDEETVNYWSATIGWRMKNGKMVTRSILIPEDIDPAPMDRILKSEGFLKGAYVLTDAAELKEKALKQNPWSSLVLSSSTEHGELYGSGDLLDGFLKAYMRDISAHYDFSYSSYNNPVGNVSFYTAQNGSDYFYGYFHVSWPIYDKYTQTIAFLKDNGLWDGGSLTAPEIRKINVTKTDYKDIGSEILFSETYTEEKDIEKILDATLPATYYSAWSRTGLMYYDENAYYEIEVFPKEDTAGYSNPDNFYSRQLLKGKEVVFE